ncbi:Tho complex subunit [Globisporangium polare]
MADEDVVIRRRLLTRTSTLGKTGLKKCAETLLTLLDSFADESIDVDVCKQDMDALFWDMEQMEFEANKTDILSFTSQRELEAYETLNAEIDASIDKVSKEIEELKTKVHVEKTVRAYKEEYESIARVINELPSRKEIAAEIAVEEKRSSEAVDTIKAVDSKLDLRNKQFSLLMSTIQNLKATLDEDVEMEEEEQLKLAEADDEDMEDGLVPAAKSPGLRTDGAGDEDGVEASTP